MKEKQALVWCNTLSRQVDIVMSLAWNKMEEDLGSFDAGKELQDALEHME